MSNSDLAMFVEEAYRKTFKDKAPSQKQVIEILVQVVAATREQEREEMKEIRGRLQALEAALADPPQPVMRVVNNERT